MFKVTLEALHNGERRVEFVPSDLGVLKAMAKIAKATSKVYGKWNADIVPTEEDNVRLIQLKIKEDGKIKLVDAVRITIEPAEEEIDDGEVEEEISSAPQLSFA